MTGLNTFASISRRLLLALAVSISLSACGSEPQTSRRDTGDAAAGTCHETNAGPGVWKCIYVDVRGSDDADGSINTPFATLDRARRSLRTFKGRWRGDVVVYIREGTYHLDKTVVFEPADSGRDGHRVVVRPYFDEQVTLAGGRPVRNWRGPDENGIYVSTDVPQTDFRHLVVDGRRATRARYPNGDDAYLKIAAWDDPAPLQQCPKKRMGKRLGLFDADASLFDQIAAKYRARLEIFHEGRTSAGIFRVGAIDKANEGGKGIRYVIPRPVERRRMFGKSFTCGLQENGLAYRFENSIGLLDQPGEWYLETSGRRALYYKPLRGASPNRSSVIAPTLETLIRFEGGKTKRVHDIVISGLQFEATTWTRPNRHGLTSVYPGVDFRDPDGWWDAFLHPAAIHLEGTHSVRVERNVLQALGGAGIALHNHTRNTVIDGNAILEIAGIGIVVDGQGFVGRFGMDGELAAPRAGRPHSVNDRVTNNRIQRYGLDYWASSGIAAAYPWRMAIEHNEVSDGLAMGISLGWYGRWPRCHNTHIGYEKALPKAKCERAAGRNRIVGNKVFAIGKLIDDVGGIYTIGHQSPYESFETGLEIRRNHVFGLRQPTFGNLPYTPVASVYVDGDSSFIRIVDNVFEKATGPDPTTLHAIFINPDAKTSVPAHDIRWSANGARKPPGDNASDPKAKPHVRRAAGLSPAYGFVPSLGR